MTEKERFIRSNTYGWQKSFFHNVVNGLDEKNKKLKEENEWLKKSIKRQQASNEESSKYIEEVVKENEQLKERISELKFLLELAKLHTEVAEGKMDKFVELKLND